MGGVKPDVQSVLRVHDLSGSLARDCEWRRSIRGRTLWAGVPEGQPRLRPHRALCVRGNDGPDFL